MRRGISQYEIYAQSFIVGTGKRNGPPMVAIVKVLGGGITVQITRYRPGHDKREDARVVSVVEFGETIQKSHSGEECDVAMIVWLVVAVV